MAKNKAALYIATNESFKTDYIKIGRIEDFAKLNQRLGTINGSVPMKYSVRDLFLTDNAVKVEMAVHRKLKKHRAPNGEFFDVSVDTATKAIQDTINNLG